MKKVGYIRTSTSDQNSERQLHGIRLDIKFEEVVSGLESDRPELNKLIDYIARGDVVIVHSVDRLTRNSVDLIKIVEEITSIGASVQFLREGITFSGNDSSAMSRYILTMMGAYLDIEYSNLRDRAMEGIKLAKARGVYKGRKVALSPEKQKELMERIAGRESKAALAREFGISRETVYSYMRKKL
jgi:DNA invertase Pin-like site-specific DNA recombinase